MNESNEETEIDLFENLKRYLLRFLLILGLGIFIFIAGQFYWWLGSILLIILLFKYILPDIFYMGFIVFLAFGLKMIFKKFSPVAVIKGKTIPSKAFESLNHLLLGGLLSGLYILFLLVLTFSLTASFFYDFF